MNRANFYWIIFLLHAVALPAQTLSPARVHPDYYLETVALVNDGSADIEVRFGTSHGAAGDTLLLPFAFTTFPDSVTRSAKIYNVFELNQFGRRSVLVVLDSAVTQNDTLEFSFHLPEVSALGKPSAKDFGNYEISYSLVHTAAVPIERFTTTIILPAGFVINKILSSTPERPANAAVSPYVLEMIDGRHCVTLTDSTVLQGDRLSLLFQAKSEKKSVLLIIALAVVAGVYLIVFRDLVAT